MGAFEFSALDGNGHLQKGVQEGDTPRQVRQLLRDRGWSPLSVEEVIQRERKQSAGFSFKRGISTTDLALTTRQLATLIRSALPLEESLRAVAEQNEKERLKSMLLGVRAKVLEGHNLADGLAEFPHIFPELYRHTIAAGEQSGHLDVVLERLADYTENRQQMRQKIMLALFYPIILTVMAVIVVAALLAYVVPEVVVVFEDIGQELPLLTRALLAASDYLQRFGLLALVLGIIGFILFLRLLKRPAFRLRFDRWLLRLPFVARLVRGFNTARFTRTLSILSASGVPILEALRIAAQVLSNHAMREAVSDAADRVREGSGIQIALAKSKIFPPMTLHLIASGEASGKLDEMLERAAINQEREMETLTAALMGIFEPLLILAMGGVVMVIVAAILLPIFELNQLVQ